MCNINPLLANLGIDIKVWLFSMGKCPKLDVATENAIKNIKHSNGSKGNLEIWNCIAILMWNFKGEIYGEKVLPCERNVQGLSVPF